MVRQLKSYAGTNIPVRIQFTIGEGQIMDFSWGGYIDELTDDDRILHFVHDKEEQQRMKVKASTLNLRYANVWAIDEVAEPEPEEVPPNTVATIGCPHCGDKIHIVRIKDDE